MNSIYIQYLLAKKQYESVYNRYHEAVLNGENVSDLLIQMKRKHFDYVMMSKQMNDYVNTQSLINSIL